MRRIFKLFAVCAIAFPINAFAFSLILQYEGEVDDRVVYFADVTAILNRTPPSEVFGDIEIRQISVTGVYENAKKPEFVHMELQFQCPNRFMLDETKYNISENKNIVRAGNTVTFRMGPESYMLRRSDLKVEPVPESDWKTSSAPMLSKAGAIACNHIEINHALHDSIKKNNKFDFDGFGKRITKLGLPADTALIGYTLPSEYLDFAWENLWWDKVLEKKRPDPTGKWSTPVSEADKQAAMEKLKRKQQELESGTASIRSSLLESIKKTNEERKADLELAKDGHKHPDGSKMNKYEAKLAAVFIGQPERKVVDLMGNPELNQVADTRFLRYTQYWEKEGVTVYGAQGVVGGSAGGYAECFAEFRSRQDANGEWRVDDILVRSGYEGEGLGRTSLLCDDVTRAR